jgi:group I intron endonuclease
MFIVYLLENKINKKCYIGKHKGKLDDNYYGSGTLIRKAIKKYGKFAFEKILLGQCNTEEEADLIEKEFIKLYDAAKDKNFYNITEGGTGGNTLKNLSKEDLEKRKVKIRKSLKTLYFENKQHFKKIKSDRMKQVRKNKNIEEQRIKKLKKTISGYSIETKNKIYESRTGKNNYQAKTIKTPDRIFYTAKDAAKYYNVSSQTILNKCNNKNFKEWKFLK